MNSLPAQITDEELIAFIDEWAALLEREDYRAAYAHTAHIPEMQWTPDLIREVIKAYSKADPNQRVTILGESTDITQRKEVDRWAPNANGRFGEIWYDLNVNGQVSDLTATFELRRMNGGVIVYLNDIHVM